MTVTALGGSGGYSWWNGYNGGLGGAIISSFSVFPGQNFFACVGGAGGMPSAGYYDGGTGGFNYDEFAAGGGGSSSILSGGNCSRIIVAGGGGGAGYYSSGGDGGAVSSIGALPLNAKSDSRVNEGYPLGGGGGGYVGGALTSNGGGGLGGTSFTSGNLLSSTIGANTGNGLITVEFSSSGKTIHATQLSQSSSMCFCVPPTYQPTGQPTGISTGLKKTQVSTKLLMVST